MFKKRCFNKRADTETLIWFYIAQLLIASFVFLILASHIFGIANNTLLEKNYFLRDLALLVNTLYAAPGNVDYTYEGNLSKYNFSLGFFPYQVALYEEKRRAGTVLVYPFMEDKSMEFKYREYEERLVFQADEKLRFAKEGEVIKTDKAKDMALHMSKLKCPVIETKGTIEGTKLVIDPGHLTEENDLGDENGDINEAGKMLEIAEKIEVLAALENLDTELTRRAAEKTAEQRFEFIENQNPDIVISLHANNKGKLTINSFVSSQSEEEIQKKSKKLACLITNKIIGNQDLKEFEINAVNPVLKKPVEGDILIENKVSIILEIGNIQSMEFFERTDAIATSIMEGMEEYYEK